MSIAPFTRVKWVSGIGATPARVNRATGELQLNLDVWPHLTREQKIFVLQHEAGHVALNTSNEHAVDAYAFEQFAKDGHSLKASVGALTDLLTFSTPEHYQRAHNQLRRALEYDAFVNNHKPAMEALNAMDGYDSLFGIGKKKNTASGGGATPKKKSGLGRTLGDIGKTLGNALVFVPEAISGKQIVKDNYQTKFGKSVGNVLEKGKEIGAKVGDSVTFGAVSAVQDALQNKKPPVQSKIESNAPAPAPAPLAPAPTPEPKKDTTKIILIVVVVLVLATVGFLALRK